MSAPVFKLQLVYADGSALPFLAGSSFERDLITACQRAILAKGVGVFKTEAAVAQAVADGMAEVLLDLKKDARRAL